MDTWSRHAAYAASKWVFDWTVGDAPLRIGSWIVGVLKKQRAVGPHAEEAAWCAHEPTVERRGVQVFHSDRILWGLASLASGAGPEHVPTGSSTPVLTDAVASERGSRCLD